MFKWLSSLPVWFQIVFSIVFGFSILYFVFLAIKKGIKIKTKDNALSIGNGESVEEYKSPHASCPHSKDIIILLNESFRLMQEKFYIQYTQKLKDQMNFAEQQIDQIRSLFQRAYLRELEKRGVKSLVDSCSYLAYRTTLFEIQNYVIIHIRQSLRENHFNEMSNTAFDNYIDNKFEFIKSSVTDLLNKLYFYKEDITREDLYDINQSIIPDIRSLFVEMFKTVKQIAIDYDMKLNELDAKLAQLIGKYV